MARTLPWLKNTSTTTTTTTRPPPSKPSKRPRLLSPYPKYPNHHHSPTKLTITPRSPSTSPPPEPPVAEPMRPGLHADDIYIMVEDEFLSVARTFTAHLHHAEYVRLKNEAKTRNVNTISKISRPVDSITKMREETRLRKKGEARQERVRKGLDGILSESKMPKTGRRHGEEGSASGSESDFDPNEGQEAPWQGTQLSKFMVKSPRKALTGLTGLQGVTANTRAAAGYERAVEKRDEREGSPTPKRAKADGEIMASVADELISDSDTEDHDLDARSRAPSRAPPASRSNAPPSHHPNPAAKPPNRPTTHKPKPSHPPPRRSFLDLTPLPKPKPPNPPPTTSIPPKPVQQQQPDPQPLNHKSPDENPTPSSSSSSREEILARRRRLKVRKEKLDGRSNAGMKADEIPIFLV